jgi:hypothetical protein
VSVPSLRLGSVTMLPDRVQERPGEEEGEGEDGECVQSRRAPEPSGAPPPRPAFSSASAASISLAGPCLMSVAQGGLQNPATDAGEVVSHRSAS